ncbi:hypothetical protein D5W64_12600 [Salmonella enterica subsp. enterica serovar Saintpaul]|nr:hypothetical protein [Salmonella enterica subsp. enterica serovar Saintpaul]
MAEMIKINKKVINDPLYTPVDRFLKERIAKLEVEGPEDELQLARERYTSLIAGDLIIENPVAFPDGITRVCFTARKTGFARVDVDIKRVDIKDILDDFAVPFIEIQDLENLKTYVKTNPTESALLWCVWLNNWGVLLSQEAAKTIDGPMDAWGNLFFNEYTMTRESLTSIDYDTLVSGNLHLSDASFGAGDYPVFIYELVLEEANLPEITSNLPETITTQRGKDFSIPNTYWFNGTTDITHVATVELSTESGYTIPVRSADGNFIEGETIFGSDNVEVTDEILVRVTYMWNGRPVKKTFKIIVKIEKDTEYDLSFVVTPPTLTVPSGSPVEFKIAAFYKDTQVKINIPANELTADPSFGRLSYQGFDADGMTMIYTGTLSTSFKPEEEQKGALYSADMRYSSGSIVEEAKAYVNVHLIRATAGPQFTIKGLTTNVTGYKGDTGEIEVSAFYGDDPIPATDLSIRPGVVGEDALIELTGVTPTGITYVLLKDSGKPGESISDSFIQAFRWIAPTGVRYTQSRTINVTVRKKSVWSLTPRYPQPLEVGRYSTGYVPCILTVNGEDVTNRISGFTFDDPEKMITRINGSPLSWIVAEVPGDGEPDRDMTMKFTFRYLIDGVWEDFEYDQQFHIKAYKKPVDPEPPVNSKVVAVPTSVMISGMNNETGQFDFRVFNEGVDITKDAIILEDRTVIPEHIEYLEHEYIEEENVIRYKYNKLEPTTATGQIYIVRPGVVGEPTNEDTAMLTVNTNVTQSRILQLKSYSTDTQIDVDGPAKEVLINLTFAGQPITLEDPQLTIEFEPTDKHDFVITETKPTGFMVKNNIWRYIGTNITESMTVKFSYSDPLDPLAITRASARIPVTTKYPPMRLEVENTDVINTAIWETGQLPFKLFAGEKEWTSAITRIYSDPGQAYISFNKLNWEVVWADKEELTLPLELVIEWTVGETKNQEFRQDVTYHLGAWDQITFKGVWSPTEIIQDSRTNGRIVATFTYKNLPATADVILNKELSTIPETMILGVGSQVEGEGLVVGYETTKGGIHDMTLAYVHKSGATIRAVIPTDIAWPHELNLINVGTNIRGYWKDKVPFTLEYNFAGTPIALSDPNMTITATSGTGDPVKLIELGDKTMTFELVKGGEQGTNYDYTVRINVSYVDPDGKTWTDSHTVPATIRVPSVSVGSNPVYGVKVWDRGEFKVTLRDERGQNVPIDGITPLGTNPYVSFVAPSNWYVIDGNTSRPITTQVMLMLAYQMGGNNYTIDVETEFQIERYDGLKFVVKPDPELPLEGVAGTGGSIQYSYTYAGEAITGVTLDLPNCVIPRNITLGELTPEGLLTYTFVGQATDNMKLVFLRPGAPENPVINVDKVEKNYRVITTSTDEVFAIESSGNAITLGWGESGVIPLTLSYGPYPVAPNAPGVRYRLADTASKAVTIGGANANGLTITATKSGTPGSVLLYPEDFIVTYEVGAPTAKQATWSTNVTIETGLATINNNDLVSGKLWDTGSFSQNVLLGEKVLTAITRYELAGAPSTYVEFHPPRGWEMVNADKEADKEVTLPMRLYYRVDSTNVEQSLDFDAKFKIAKRTGGEGGGGEEVVKFECTYSPTSVETGVGVDATIRVRPLYKDKPVGGNAPFKQNLSTFPDSLEVKEVKVVGEYYEITVTGTEPGLGEMELVFWSPEAGATPTEDHVWSAKLPTKVMGELGVEIGVRDNLLIGKHLDTGTYKMEVLFAGILLNVEEEITAGRLSFSVEAATENNMNAGVLNLDGVYTKDTFGYKLEGPLEPGKTIDISDFIIVRYMYGGTAYTRRVEIPEQYTTSAPVVSDVTYSVEMFQKGSIKAPTVMCDGVDLGPMWVQTYDNNEPPSTYIKMLVKAFEVINADEVEKVETISTKYVGTYRHWDWEGIANTIWTIKPWNQKYFEAVMTPTEVTTQVGKKWIEQVQFKLNGQQIYGADSWIDFTNANWPDYFDLIFSKTEVVQGVATTTFEAESLKSGELNAVIRFYQPQGVKPGIEFKDYVDLPLHYTSTDIPLTVTANGNVVGGNEDTVGMGGSVKLGTKTIPFNDPNLTLELDPVNIFEITYTGDVSYNVKIIAPLDTPHGLYYVKRKYTYVDPVTGLTHKGEVNQGVSIGWPTDYPRLANTGGKKVVLWELGTASTVGLKIVSGPASTDITTQCEPVKWISKSVGVEPWVDLPEAPNTAKNWWQVVSGPKTGTNVRLDHEVTIKAPFRGDFVEIPATIYFIMDGVGTVYELSGTAAPNPFELIQNKDTVVRFKMTYRGKPTTNVILNEAESQFSQFDEEKFTIKSVVADGNDMVVTLTGLVTTAGSFIFCWDVKDVAEPVMGKTRITMTVSAYAGLTITPVPQTVKIWQSYDFSVTAVSSPGTDLRRELTITGVSDPRIEVKSKAAGQPHRIQIIGAPEVEETVDVVYNVKISDIYGGQTVQVTIPTTFEAWDQVQYKATLRKDMVNKLILFKDGEKDVISVPAVMSGSEYFVLFFDTLVWNKNSPNGSNANNVSIINNFIGGKGLIKYYTGGTGSGSYISVGVQPVKEGLEDGYQLVEYMESPTGGVTRPNGYPQGTLDKNVSRCPITWEMFKPEVVFKDGILPDPIIIPAGAKPYVSIKVPLSLTFGRISINLGDTTTGNSGVGVSDVFRLHGAAGADYIDVESMFENTGESDVETTMPVVVNYWYKGLTGTPMKVYTFNYDYPVIFKGTPGAPDPVVEVTDIVDVTTDVWKVNKTYPFSVQVDGVNVPLTSSNVTAISVPENVYVEQGTFSEGWKVIKGSAEGESIWMNWNFTFVHNLRTYNLKATARVIINPYDGVELKVTLLNPSAFNNGIISRVSQSTGYNFQVELRGKILDNAGTRPYSLWTTKTNSTMIKGSNLTTTQPYVYTGMLGLVDGLVSEDTDWYIGLTAKETDVNAVEGVDFVKLTIPTYCYNTERFYPVTWTKELKGKVQEPLYWNYTMRKGITPINLTSSGFGTGLADFGAGNQELAVNGADWWRNPNYLQLKFANVIPVGEKVTPTVFTIGPQSVNVSLHAKFTDINLIQVSTVEHPIATATTEEITARIKDSGDVPFHVTWKGNDVTSQVSAVRVQSNSYVEMRDGKWYVKFAEIANTTVLPVFELDITVENVLFTLKLPIKFNILGWNGKEIIATADPVILGVGEKGLINIKGNYSGVPLPGNVVFDTGNSDTAGGLVSYGVMNVTESNQLAIVVNGVKAGRGEGMVQLRSVHDTGNSNPGSDFLNVPVQIEVIPANLDPIAAFATTGEGSRFVPAVLKQAVMLGTEQLDNDDAGLAIELTNSDVLTIESVGKDTITYNFLTATSVPVVHTATLTFTYKGRSEYVVEIQVTQNPVEARPVITNLTPMTVEYGKSYATPFKVEVAQ